MMQDSEKIDFLTKQLLKLYDTTIEILRDMETLEQELSSRIGALQHRIDLEVGDGK